MAYTEIKNRNENKYFYRVLSIREKNKISKKRIYLGTNLSKQKLEEEKIKADKEIYSFKRKKKGNEFEKIKKETIKILKENGIKRAGIFGSYARGEQKKDSDLDLLIDPSKKVLGFAFYDLQEKLSKKLNKKVDILTYKGINHLLKKRILNQEVRIIWKKKTI